MISGLKLLKNKHQVIVNKLIITTLIKFIIEYHKCLICWFTAIRPVLKLVIDKDGDHNVTMVPTTNYFIEKYFLSPVVYCTY